MSPAKYASCIHTTIAKKCMKNHRLVAELGAEIMTISNWSYNKAVP